MAVEVCRPTALAEWSGRHPPPLPPEALADPVASVLALATLSPESSALLALTVRKIGAIADPFGRDDHQRPGEAVDRRGVGGSKPGECGPCLLGGFAGITCLVQSRPRLIEFEALDDRRIRSGRPPAEGPGQVLDQMIAYSVNQLPRPFLHVLD